MTKINKINTNKQTNKNTNKQTNKNINKLNDNINFENMYADDGDVTAPVIISSWYYWNNFFAQFH